MGRVRPPPFDDLLDDLLLGVPSVDRKAESALSDEHPASDGLEGLAHEIVFELVVTAEDRSISAMLDENLRGSVHMTCGMKRDGRATFRDRLAVANGLQGDVAETAPQDRRTLFGAEIVAVPRARVI